MRYWIDGYNLLFRFAKSYKGVRENERKILFILNEWVTHNHLEATIVFDGRQKDPPEAIRTNLANLAVIYTPQHQTADDYILEEIAHSKEPSQDIVVSSDRELTGKAHQRGAKVKSVESFFKILTKKKKKKSSSEKNFKESDAEIQRLRQIFEGKLKDLFRN